MPAKADDLIYLDHNASTFLDPAVLAAMQPFLTRHQGNPSSGHLLGRQSRQAVDQARAQAAALLSVDPDDIIFTSGGTEANNHALIGTAWALRGKGNHIVTTAVEHPAILEVCRFLDRQGFTHTKVPVASGGVVDPAAVAAAITDQTILISIMRANNETGALQPVEAVAAIAQEHGIWCHTDAAQAVGKIPVSASGLGVHMLSLAGHKFYGPKGSGLLVIRGGANPANLMYGAGHERGRRPGTENVAAIVGLGMACELAGQSLVDGTLDRIEARRDRMENELLTRLPQAVIHARAAARLPNTLSVGIPGLSAPELMAAMPQVAVSAGAACHGNKVVASHVLAAMGVDPQVAMGTLRFSLGRTTTAADVDRALAALFQAVAQVSQGRGPHGVNF